MISKKERKEKVHKRAENEIKELFRQAESADKKHADRYVEIALKISTKTKTPVPKELKRRYCKNCNVYLVPDKNCRIRLSKGKIVYYCLECKHFRRFSYK